MFFRLSVSAGLVPLQTKRQNEPKASCSPSRLRRTERARFQNVSVVKSGDFYSFFPPAGGLSSSLSFHMQKQTSVKGFRCSIHSRLQLHQKLKSKRNSGFSCVAFYTGSVRSPRSFGCCPLRHGDVSSPAKKQTHLSFHRVLSVSCRVLRFYFSKRFKNVSVKVSRAAERSGGHFEIRTRVQHKLDFIHFSLLLHYRVQSCFLFFCVHE